jgi:DNA-binding MarR family transcriptional regulator
MAADLAYILKGYELTNTQRVVYGVLDGLSRASAKRGKPYTYIGQKALAERVGVCPRTVYAALKRLQEVGLIMVKRRGLTRTNAIYVLSPSATKEERQIRRVICESGTAKNAIPIINPKRDNNNTIDISINPQNSDNAASPQMINSGVTAKKGKPTNKRPHINYEERQRMKKKYKDYLYQKLNVKELYDSMLYFGYDDAELKAVEKVIELISTTMSSKGKIMVNGALITPIQWWSIVKEITQDGVLNLIYKLPNQENIRNYKAYMLASLYNEAMKSTLTQPWYKRGTFA